MLAQHDIDCYAVPEASLQRIPCVTCERGVQLYYKSLQASADAQRVPVSITSAPPQASCAPSQQAAAPRLRAGAQPAPGDSPQAGHECCETDLTAS